MEFRSLGPSGLQVSVLGLGCNNFGMRLDEPSSIRVVQAALEAGVSHFDTADSYGGGKSEEYLGKAVKDHRDDVLVGATSLEQVVANAAAAEVRLGADEVDAIAEATSPAA